MGQGRIINHIAEGRYSIQLLLDNSSVEQQYNYLNDKKTRIQDAIVGTSDELTLRALFSQLNSVDLELTKLSDMKTESPKTMTVWCADLTEDLLAGTLVGTIEIENEYGDGNTVQIQPAYNDNAIYTQARDGRLVQWKAQKYASWFLNQCLLPGWQKWKPYHRYGTITYIDYENDFCSLELHDASSSAQDLDINQSTVLGGVPIEYMDCNADAFSEGDEVVISFSGSWLTPKVIGFKEYPQGCGFYFQFTDECSGTIADSLNLFKIFREDETLVDPSEYNIEYKSGSQKFAVTLLDIVGNPLGFWFRYQTNLTDSLETQYQGLNDKTAHTYTPPADLETDIWFQPGNLLIPVIGETYYDTIGCKLDDYIVLRIDDSYTVWDVANSEVPTIIDPVTELPISLPCTLSEIANWYNAKTKRNGDDLYNVSTTFSRYNNDCYMYYWQYGLAPLNWAMSFWQCDDGCNISCDANGIQYDLVATPTGFTLSETYSQQSFLENAVGTNTIEVNLDSSDYHYYGLFSNIYYHIGSFDSTGSYFAIRFGSSDLSSATNVSSTGVFRLAVSHYNEYSSNGSYAPDPSSEAVRDAVYTGTIDPGSYGWYGESGIETKNYTEWITPLGDLLNGLTIATSITREAASGDLRGGYLDLGIYPIPAPPVKYASWVYPTFTYSGVDMLHSDRQFEAYFTYHSMIQIIIWQYNEISGSGNYQPLKPETYYTTDAMKTSRNIVVFAASDRYDSAVDENPFAQTRNTDFETAIYDLYTHHYSGISSPVNITGYDLIIKFVDAD